MPSARRHITHVFGGGWATDFGPSWSTDQQRPLDQQRSTLVLPFLVDAEDVLFELDGAPRTAPGTVKLNSAALESGARIMGLHDYWKMGNSGVPVQKRVIFIGTKVYADAAKSAGAERQSAKRDVFEPEAPVFFRSDGSSLVLLPGEAHMSSTRSSGFGSRTTGGIMDAAPWM